LSLPPDSVKKLEAGVTLVTGGTGFIGSYIVDSLISNHLNVRVIDNLSSGNLKNLHKSKDEKNFEFVNKDLNNVESLSDILKDAKTVFHLAANPEVRIGYNQPEISFKENIQNTFHLLEKIRKSNVENIVFASTSTVYGEPDIIPTPEDYGPLIPISAYGASKLACEALISSYCNNYGIKGAILRFANIVGARSNHGVIGDFIHKLQNDKTKLEVLGDGKQSKSYLHVEDCISSFFFCLSKMKKSVEVFNVGNDDKTDVMKIAAIVRDGMGLKNAEIYTTGGVDGGRGWVGDVKLMFLDITKLKQLGWKPKLSSDSSVQLATKELVEEIVVKKTT